ncbi:MAG: dihydrodipicolinate synthase family protein [Acidobacteriota bacterium]
MLDPKGVYTVLPTPFTHEGDLDRASLRRVVDLFIADGAAGLVVLGATSEAARLSDAERLEVFGTVMEHVNGRAPVVVGATAEGLRTCLAYARQAASAGGAGLLVSPPRARRLDSDAVRRHFHALAAAVDLPIVIQDYPPIAGFAMEPGLLVRIAREVPAARIVKLEDPPTPCKVARIREEADGLRIGILGGLGGGYLLEELIAGADGAMTGFAYPGILADVVRKFHGGRPDEAADAFYRHVALMRFEFQEGIGVALRKEMLRRRGAIEHAGVRAPGARLDAPTYAALERILKWMGLERKG